jgi:O-antigen/teichoic acid export membrane protein
VAVAAGRGALSVFVVLTCMAGAAAAAALLIVVIRRANTGWLVSRRAVAKAAKDYWTYGKWALGTAGVMWAHINGFTPAVGMLLGIREAGAFAAVMNFFLPVGATCNALGRLFLPNFSRTYARHGAAAVWRKMHLLLAAVVAGTLAYAAVVTVFRTQLFHVFYAGGFDDYANLVPIVLFSAVLSTGAATTDIGLRAVRAPRDVFMVNAAAALTSLVFGWPVTSMFGLSGTAVCLVGSGAVAQLVSLRLLRKVTRSERAPEGEAYGTR